MKSAYKFIPLLIIAIVNFGFWGFTLEDTWIFLSIARDSVESHTINLYGATSALWGVINYLIYWVSPTYSLTLVKLFSFFFWVASYYVLFYKKGELKKNVFFAILFAFLPSSIWSYSGMDTSLSVFALSCIIKCTELHYFKKRRYWLIVIAITIASIMFLIRPEFIWLPFAIIGYYFFLDKRELSKLTNLFAITFLFIALSLIIYENLTGVYLPSSQSKILEINLTVSISLIYFILQYIIIIILTDFKRINNLFGFFVGSIILLRLVEHFLLGGIDHRVLAPISVLILYLFYLSNPRYSLSKYGIIFLFYLVIYGINLDNAKWYSSRTEQVHQEVVDVLSSLDMENRINTIGTEEVGILSFYFGQDKILDYHGLISEKLNPSNLKFCCDILVFSGDLLKANALKNGFKVEESICYNHRRTLYIRSPAISPPEYCKTIYVKEN